MIRRNLTPTLERSGEGAHGQTENRGSIWIPFLTLSIGVLGTRAYTAAFTEFLKSL
jgi:hypothetical protein